MDTGNEAVQIDIVNNDPKDLPIEKAQENSTKAPETSSEKPLENTHQDLKVKPVKLLQLKI